MKSFIFLFTAFVFAVETTQKTTEEKIALGTFNGSSASLCYTNTHLANIMTYFIDNGKVYYNASLQHNETEGFYIEGTTKKNNSYEMTRVTLVENGNKLYITTKSKIYYCASKIEGDCILTVRKLEGGRVTRYEPSSKSGRATGLTPGSYAGTKKKIPATLVNYVKGLNIEACN